MAEIYRVFVIACCDIYVRFYEFEFGSRYKEFLCSYIRKEDKLLEETKARVFRSRWAKLTELEGRKDVLCQLMTLLEMHEQSLANA